MTNRFQSSRKQRYEVIPLEGYDPSPYMLDARSPEEAARVEEKNLVLDRIISLTGDRCRFCFTRKNSNQDAVWVQTTNVAVL